MADDFPAPPEPDSPEDATRGEGLGRSFRQARKEMWVMLGAWIVFFLWVTISCARTAFAEPGEHGEITTFLGMPSWVATGIAIPWVAANLFIIWFALGFMKDTPLPADEPDPELETSPTAE